MLIKFKVGVALSVFISVFLFISLSLFADEGIKNKETAQAKAMDQTEQDTGAFTPAYKNEAGVKHDVDTYFRYVPSRCVDAQDGKVGIIDSGFEYSYSFKAMGKLPLKFTLVSQYIGINNSTAVKLPAHLTRLGIDMEATLPFFFKDTYFRVGFTPEFNSDNWTADAASFRMPQRYFAMYMPNDKWTFIAGAVYYPHYETPVLPIFGVIYKPNDKWAFNIIPDRPNISYMVNDNLTLFVEGGAELSEYDVTKDNIEHVKLQYKELNVGTGIRYKVGKYVTGSVVVGGAFDRYLQYSDSQGKINIDSGFYSEARLQIQI